MPMISKQRFVKLPRRRVIAVQVNVEVDFRHCSMRRRLLSLPGDLGMFGRGAMQKPFEEATFALDVDQMSNVVDSDSGLHVILRIA